MAVRAITLRNFRSYERATVAFGRGLNIVFGPNGAGKTNLLEAIYFACTGRSCRTANDRELVSFGSTTTRVVLSATGATGDHELAVGFEPREPKHMSFDGAPILRLLDAPDRPLVSVFLPDRLELVKGTPSLRRAHLDQFVAALWPARAENRRAYASALAQRNALLNRVRAGRASLESVAAWEAQLAHTGISLMTDRREAVELLSSTFGRMGELLGLPEAAGVAYRPRSRAGGAEELMAELQERREADLDRGFTGHGPHRDELLITHGTREARVFGSQGQQRVMLLALLLAERDVLTRVRHVSPVLLLDDVMSELDATRRRALVELLRSSRGQAILTTTDLDHVPDADLGETSRIAVTERGVLQALEAAA